MEISTPVAEDAALFGLGEMVSSGGLELRRDGHAVGLETARRCTRTTTPTAAARSSSPFSRVLSCLHMHEGSQYLSASTVMIVRKGLTYHSSVLVGCQCYVNSLGPDKQMKC